MVVKMVVGMVDKVEFKGLEGGNTFFVVVGPSLLLAAAGPPLAAEGLGYFPSSEADGIRFDSAGWRGRSRNNKRRSKLWNGVLE